MKTDKPNKEKQILYIMYDLEDKMREIEDQLSFMGFTSSQFYGEDYVKFMHDLGFMRNNKFLSIRRIIEVAREKHNGDFMVLESVYADFSIVYKYFVG